MRSLVAATAFLVLSGPVGPRVVSASAQPVEFVRWADSSMPVPGGQGNFFFDAVAPSFCELGLVFQGLEQPTLASGIYRAVAPGQAELLVNESTPIPGGVGTFRRVEKPVCSGRRVLFRATGNSPAETGLYLWEAGQVRAVVTGATPSPIGPLPLRNPSQGALEGSLISLDAQLDLAGSRTVFLLSDQLRAIVVPQAPVPWRPERVFLGASGARLSAGELVFRASFDNSETALVRWDGVLSLVADRTTPVPDQPGATFEQIFPPAISQGRVVFVGSTPLGEGIYQHEGGLLSTLLPPGTALSRGISPYDVEQVQVEGPRFAFIGHPVPGRNTLYLSSGHGFSEVVSQVGVLDGRQVLNFRYALAAGKLTLQVWFFDSSSALYVADLSGAAEVPLTGAAGRLLLVMLLAAAGLSVLVARR